MSATADHAEERTGLAQRLGFQPDQVVQELGFDDDTEQDLREAIEVLTGTELVDEDYEDVADAVLLWFRDEDGDLTDELVDAIGLLEDDGMICLLTPKTGRPGHIEPSDVQDAAKTAGLNASKSITVGDWSASRLVTPKGAKQARR
ncbi:hypothetical protein GCM10010218_14550 [Streptomyces mashuensis]|uniref:DUF3052 domain-containing protein n=1 Tax=Streptomyces mashuensis TaxID=33904 RepID=A0A919EBT0_9ACTN|nr:DUF3052 domain-containing protein [Streptomyces mashuensis]GHF34482.1 hypothetical protein GCM10010218_14550 [Streptomyces mashuensis]